MKKILWLIVFVFILPLESRSLKVEDGLSSLSSETIFADFFAYLCDSTPAGYAIFGHKPLFFDGFCSLDCYLPGTNEHKNAVLSMLAYEILKQAQVKDDWIFTIKSTEKFKSYEILIGNKLRLAAAIEPYQQIFSLAFGAKSNASTVIQALEKGGFQSLKGEITLQGIVLGYGYENALSYERYTKKKEVNVDDIIGYTPESTTDFTKIPFSYRANTPESLALISQYQSDQKKLESIFLDKSWFQQVLTMCFNHFPEISKKQVQAEALAWSIHKASSIYFSEEFVEGIKMAEAGKVVDEPSEWWRFNTLYRKDLSTNHERIKLFAGWKMWMHYKGQLSLTEILKIVVSDEPQRPPELLDLLLFEYELYKSQGVDPPL